MLSALETRIPPPVLFLALAAIVWSLPGSSLPPAQLVSGVPVLFAGLAINAWLKVLFRRVGTTLNPLRPELSSALITFGPYRYSRNPMYLGYALALLGWVICMGKPFGLIAVVFFVCHVTIFKIRPEEPQLAARFPVEYAAYKKTVRRWV
jgi:protein-S-isoprenylcysteine O-methyltransferase Ste14